MISEDEMLKRQFEADFEIAKKINVSYRKIMRGIISDYNITVDKFMRKTHLSKSTYYNLVEGKRKPAIETIVAFAVVFGISLRNIETLLRAFGLGFEHKNIVHHAYTRLIEQHSGKTITECNQILNKIGIEPAFWLKDPYNYEEYRMLGNR